MADASRSALVLLLLGLSLLFSTPAESSRESRRYRLGEEVPLWANKIGPIDNPSETYEFYDLPFCRPYPLIRKKESLGEVLNGDRFTNTLYKITFGDWEDFKEACKRNMSTKEIARFRDAIQKNYYYQMNFDDIPFWGFIGRVENNNKLVNDTGLNYVLFPNMEFEIYRSNDQVTNITVASKPSFAVDITEDIVVEITFSYQVRWFDNGTFSETYSKKQLNPGQQEVHWFALSSSIFLVLLLMSLLGIIFTRKLKSDFYRYRNDVENNDFGWKNAHGDVFRYPPHKSLLCAVLGTGTQLLILFIFIFFLAFFGAFHPSNRGTVYMYLIVVFALTSAVAGYASSSFYSQLEGTDWTVNVLLTGILFTGPLFSILTILNTVALAYHATAAMPFGTIVVIFLIWSLVTTPLLLVGGALGSTSTVKFQAPCSTRRFPRLILSTAWYRRILLQMFFAGLFPSSAIFVELPYAFTSMWYLKPYTIDYKVLFIIFIMLILVTAFMSVGLTYYQLAKEDYKWWWRSVLCGGSSALFVFGYCCYFYARSRMSGLLQFSFYFGYNVCMCYAFFLILGTVSFHASLLFVRRIYGIIKTE